MRHLLLALALLATPAAAQQNVTPTGIWRNQSDNVRIRISKCGPNICGKVHQASDRAKADAARGGHPNLIGMNLFEEFSRTGPNTFQGRVFVPDINRRFSGRLTMDSPRQLTVRGCLVRNTGCRSDVWLKVG
jgi:uncharacterized protein (DUF2147 family)